MTKLAKTALIGYTGFVGQNIKDQFEFEDYYNSKNIEDIDGKVYDLIVSAGTYSLVWKANLEPEEDAARIDNLINHLSKVKAKHFVLISTIFVYPDPFNVDEDSIINPEDLSPYGINRYRLEQFVGKRFDSYTIIRLPNLFGNYLKKNFIYDLIFNNRLDLTHKESKMQWYNLKNIWKDISIALENKLKVVNFAVEPIRAKDIAKYCLNLDFKTITAKPALNHNMRTKYAALYNSKSKYLYGKTQIMKELKEFISRKNFDL